MKNMSVRVLVLLISVLFVFSLSYAVEMKQPPAAIKTDKMPSTSVMQVLKCPDLEARLTLTKTKSGTNGIINLNGQICNVGTADYVSPPLAPAQATLAGYDPKRPLTGTNYKIIAGKAVTNLTKGACTPVSGSYTIPLVIEWGHRTANTGECQAEVEFSLNIGRNVPDDVNFRRNEDCKTTNNLAKQNVKYMVQCPW